eukprot:259211_1
MSTDDTKKLTEINKTNYSNTQDTQNTTELPKNVVSDSDNDETEEKILHWIDIAKQLKEDAEGGEHMDIYQMCSVMHNWKNEDDGCFFVTKFFYYCKAICCSLFQTVGLAIFMVEIISNNEKEPCAYDGFWPTRVIAIIACAYISLTTTSLLFNLDEQCLYNIDTMTMRDAPPFINMKWIYLGFYVNFFSLFIAIYGSYFVIYISESTFDIVLNSVAIFFVVEIDDLMIDGYDYKRVEKWFDDHYTEEYKNEYHDYNYNANMGCCQRWWTKCGSCTILIAMVTCMLIAFVAPFYVGICF